MEDPFAIDIDDFKAYLDRAKKQNYEKRVAFQARDTEKIINLITTMLIQWKQDVVHYTLFPYYCTAKEYQELYHLIRYFDDLWFVDALDIPKDRFLKLWRRFERAYYQYKSKTHGKENNNARC